MKNYTVKEGSTGILELIDEVGNISFFQPDCDLDKTRELLYKFYNLKTNKGKLVKESYQYNDIDWFPTTVSRLYWHYFYSYIKYQDLIEKYISGQINFQFERNAKYNNFHDLINQIDSKNNQSFIRIILKIIQRYLVPLRNKLITRKNGDLLLYSYSINDFRTKEITKEISKDYQITFLAPVTTKHLFKYFFNRDYFIIATFYSQETIGCSLSESHGRVFQGAIDFANRCVSENITNHSIYKDCLKKDYKLFLGIDDANWVYPILYAAQDLGIRTLGFQHGAYQKRHEAYFLSGIDNYRWYDNVIVWGKFWKEIIHKNTDLFEDSFHIIGSNKHHYEYTKITLDKTEKSVLIPYEFSSDTQAIGEYIKMFIDKGYKIYFKPRIDDPLQDQIDAYMLGKYEDKIHVMEIINPENMSKIDIVAGTFTTLLYELLPYNKPLWILETSMKLSYDMIDHGFASLFKLEDFANIDIKFERDISKKIAINTEYLFGEKSLSSILDTYIIDKL